MEVPFEKIQKFQKGVDYALEILGKNGIMLKEAQYECLEAIVCRSKDVLAVLPTGYGKSLIYQSLPLIYDYVESSTSSLVIVVSPLNALMQDQVEKLKEKINVTVLKQGNANSLNDAGSCKILFAHPEVLVTVNFRSFPLRDKVKAIVVDEAHLVVEWKDFRPAYAKLAVLSSFFPNVPIIGLTATATKATQEKINVSLGLCEPTMVIINPDRANIFFESHRRKNTGDDKLAEILEPLAIGLKEQRHEFPLTLIYGNLETISECYLYFDDILGDDQYDPPGASATSKNRMFTQFHAQYPESERQRIITELVNGTSKLRILFVTVAFGIGIDINNIRQVIHIGVPYTMEEYFQEAGRCARDGLPGKAVVYYNSYDISNAKTQMAQVMRVFVEGEKCKREVILNHFGHKVPRRSPDHTCCDFHRKTCNCDSCVLVEVEDLETLVDDMAVNVLEKDSNPRMVEKLPPLTSQQEDLLYTALANYRLSLHGSGKSCVGGISLATGFNTQLIDMVVSKATDLHCLEDIKTKLPIFNFQHAEKIWEIISLVRGSI